MFKVHKKEIEVAGKKISLETGKVARQADGAIIATCGETVILATVVGAKKVNPDMDYFPLSVNYQEKYLSLIHISEPTRPERIGDSGVCV